MLTWLCACVVYQRGVYDDPHKRAEYDCNAPFYGTTSNQADYQPYDSLGRALARPPGKLPPNIPFNGTTEYHDHYYKKQVRQQGASSKSYIKLADHY